MPRPNSGTGSAGIKRPNSTIDKDKDNFGTVKPIVGGKSSKRPKK